MWDTILSGNVWEGEVTNVKKNGENYDVKLVIAPVSGDACDIVGFIAIQNDVTEQNKIKLELQSLGMIVTLRLKAA